MGCHKYGYGNFLIVGQNEVYFLGKNKINQRPKLVSGIAGEKFDPRTGESILTISGEMRSIQEQIT